jgi:hypothetical protein
LEKIFLFFELQILCLDELCKQKKRATNNQIVNKQTRQTKQTNKTKKTNKTRQRRQLIKQDKQTRQTRQTRQTNKHTNWKYNGFS